MKKNLWKIMAALVIVALPFVVASCGSDEEEGPKTYTYSWLLQNTTLSSSATTAQRQAALVAEEAVNALFAAGFTQRGFKVNATAQTFSVETEDEASVWDGYAKRAVSTVKGTDDLAIAVEVLPSNAKIVVKRGSKVLVDEKLRN